MNLTYKSMGRLLIKIFARAIIISSIIFCACEKNQGSFTLGEEYIESQSELNLIETFAVDLSTVILDTVVTTGTGTLLVGNYRDYVFGKISSRSFFQLGIPDTFNVEADDVYDSLSLVLIYNDYFFGDTTRSQQLSVHRLTENIEAEDDYAITNATTFSYDPVPIGSIIYTPQPNSDMDTVSIKISDDIGRDLFTKLKEDSDILTDNERFIDFFHGLVLMADETYEGAIIGFKSDVSLILYTRRTDLTTVKINHEFKLEDTNKQFNNITHDFSATQLNALVKQQTELANTVTGGMAFLQGGIGLVIRVDFPALEDLLMFDRGVILKAQLCLSPSPNSYNEFDLPSQLVIYEADQRNLMLDDLGGVAYSTLTVDEFYNEETMYFFDITNYLTNELADSYVDPDKGLFITLPLTDLKTTFDRLIIDAQNQNTKLKIYYLSY